MKKYYILFEPAVKINYLYLLRLYCLAEFDLSKRIYNKIPFNNYTQLADLLQVSSSTIRRIRDSADYSIFLEFNYDSIVIRNDFRDKSRLFVVLTDIEVQQLLELQDSEIVRYYLYIKYYTLLAEKQGKKQDFTAKQYLSAIGSSVKSNDNISRISSYNTILQEKNLISIDKYRDQQKNLRNIYSLCMPGS